MEYEFRWESAIMGLLAVEDPELSQSTAPLVLGRRWAGGVLSGILADAVKARKLAVNPTKGVENLPRKTGKRRVYLSADDVNRLADVSGEHRTLVLLLAYTGIRWREAIGLRVRDVEFLKRRLMVSENAVQLGIHHSVGPTKGGMARSVPVPQFVLNALSEQCKDKKPNDLVFPA